MFGQNCVNPCKWCAFGERTLNPFHRCNTRQAPEPIALHLYKIVDEVFLLRWPSAASHRDRKPSVGLLHSFFVVVGMRHGPFTRQQLVRQYFVVGHLNGWDKIKNQESQWFDRDDDKWFRFFYYNNRNSNNYFSIITLCCILTESVLCRHCLAIFSVRYSPYAVLQATSVHLFAFCTSCVHLAYYAHMLPRRALCGARLLDGPGS